MKNNDAYGSRETALDSRIEELEASEAKLFKIALLFIMLFGCSALLNGFFIFANFYLK